MIVNKMLAVPHLTSFVKGGDPPQELHLNFMQEEDILQASGTQYIAFRKMKKLHVIEIKGTFEADWHLELFPRNCFFLLFQYIGRSERDAIAHTALSGGEYIGFSSGQASSKIRVKQGKTWMVLLGIKRDKGGSLSAEWPMFKKPATISQPYFSKMDIGYRVKQVFEKIGQCEDSPHALRRKVDYHHCQLMAIYHQDLKDKERKKHKEDIVIYYEAIDYITKHYMDEGINVDGVAKALNVTPRKLYRVFKDKHITIHGAIQIIRLHKARELLRRTNESIDSIAFRLNFSTAHYFYNKYVQQFGHSPSREREMHRRPRRKIR